MLLIFSVASAPVLALALALVVVVVVVVVVVGASFFCSLHLLRFISSWNSFLSFFVLSICFDWRSSAGFSVSFFEILRDAGNILAF